MSPAETTSEDQNKLSAEASRASRRAGRRFDPRLVEGPIARSLFLLAVPIMAGNILQIAYQMIDAFWVGRVGAAAVASVSVSMPIMFVLISLGMGFAVAGSTLIAQYVGARDEAMVNHVAAQTLLSMVGISLTLGIIGFILTPYLLDLMQVQPDVYHNAVGFLRVSFAGLPFAFGYFMFQSQMRGIGQVTVPLYIIAGTVTLNFVLDPLLIFNAHLGVMGAAFATLIAQSIAAAAGLALLFSGRFGIKLRWSALKPDFAFIKRAFNLGYPASIESSTRGLGAAMMTFLITGFGTVTIASYGVGTNVLNFANIPAMGLSMATSTLAGQNIGAGNIHRAERVARFAALLSFSLLSGLGIIAFVFAPEIAGFFVPEDKRVIHEAAVFIRTVSWSFGFIGLQFAFMGVLRASGNLMTAMIISLVSQWCLQFPIAFVLSHRTPMGAHGIWWAFPISNVAIAVIAGIVFSRGGWKRRQLIEPRTEEEAEQQEIADQVML